MLAAEHLFASFELPADGPQQLLSSNTVHYMMSAVMDLKLAGVPAKPGLRAFLSSCQALKQLTIDGADTDEVTRMQLGVAMAALSNLSSLCCHKFVPAAGALS